MRRTKWSGGVILGDQNVKEEQNKEKKGRRSDMRI